MNDIIVQVNHGATFENDRLIFANGLHTAIEPIFLDVDLSVVEFEVDVDIGSIAYEVDTDMAIRPQEAQSEQYDGDYTVTPNFNEQVLETAHKYMRDDVNVEPILVSRVSNPAGGTTVYIGGVF